MLPEDSEALRVFTVKTALIIFHESVVSKFPEETCAQRKSNQIKKYAQKASESCYI